MSADQFIQPAKRNADVPSGIVHQYVQAIVFLTDGLDQSVDGLGIPLIKLHGFRAAAGIINGCYLSRLPHRRRQHRCQ